LARVNLYETIFASWTTSYVTLATVFWGWGYQTATAPIPMPCTWQDFC